MQQENQSTTPRIKEFGTWTEQTSSSGKRYYYNSATNVSQWEKPTEWKQAEKLRASTTTAVNQVKNGGGTGSSGQTPTEKVSPTSSTAVKPPQQQSVSVISSKNPIRHSSSSTFSAKPDSSGSAAHKSAAFGGNSASPNSGGPASKKARLEEDDGKVTSSSSTTLGHGNCGTISRKPVANISQPQVSSTTGSGNNRGEQAHSHTHHRVTAGGSGEHSGSGTPTSTTNKTRLGQYSAASADRISSNSRGTPDYHKNVSPAAAGVTMDKSNQGSGTHYSPLTSTKPRPLMSINTSSSSFATGKDPRQQQQQPSSIVTNGMAATEEQEKVKEKRHEKASTPTNEAIFREDKYQKYWRPDLATASRRTLGIDNFAFEVKKCADRTGKQMITAFALDRDINSIRTLDRCALLRTELCKQRLDTVQQRIQELESKSGGGAGQ